MSDETMHQVSFVGTHGDMWWQTRIETGTMPTKVGINSKCELSWNTISSYGLNTQWFHVELFQINDATPQRHP
jgi:hypothetical protein